MLYQNQSQSVYVIVLFGYPHYWQLFSITDWKSLPFSELIPLHPLFLPPSQKANSASSAGSHLHQVFCIFLLIPSRRSNEPCQFPICVQKSSLRSEGWSVDFRSPNIDISSQRLD